MSDGPTTLQTHTHTALEHCQKFTLRPHHVWKYGRHPICDGRLRLGEEKKKEEMNGKNIMSASATQGGHNQS